MDLRVLAKNAVCHDCSRSGHFVRDYWDQPNKKGKGGGMGMKGKNGKNGKVPKASMARSTRKELVTTEVGHVASECPKKNEQHNAGSSGGDAVHCMT